MHRNCLAFSRFFSNQELDIDEQQLEVFYSLLEHPLDLNNLQITRITSSFNFFKFSTGQGHHQLP